MSVRLSVCLYLCKSECLLVCLYLSVIDFSQSVSLPLSLSLPFHISSGEFFFDKAVTGFLKELFEKWREAGCSHDVTIVFFWRLYYDIKTFGRYSTLPPSHTPFEVT